MSENGYFSRAGGIVKLFFKENNKKAYPDIFSSFFVLRPVRRGFSEDGSFNEGRWRGCLAVVGTTTVYLAPLLVRRPVHRRFCEGG